MHRTRVKICGIMRVEDARSASDAGADAIGMIFHPPARRNIPLEQARAIMAAIGPFVTPVGVFVDASTQTIAQTAGALGLRVVQLNGQETPQQVAELGRMGLRVIKAIRVDARLGDSLQTWRSAGEAKAALAGLALETAGPSPGGSGIENDWSAIERYQRAGAFAGLPPIIAAGGLGPATVDDVVRMIRPWGVDVSSGVEAELGQKSPRAIAEFIEQVRRGEG